MQPKDLKSEPFGLTIKINWGNCLIISLVDAYSLCETSENTRVRKYCLLARDSLDVMTNVACQNAQGAVTLCLSPAQSCNIKSVKHNWFPTRLKHKTVGKTLFSPYHHLCSAMWHCSKNWWIIRSLNISTVTWGQKEFFWCYFCLWW